MRHSLLRVALLALVPLAGCTSGQSAVQPTVSSTSIPNAGVPQIAVGVATLNRGTTTVTGLNVVTTYRQANGLAAVLLNTPTLTGPTGFVVPPTPVQPAPPAAPATAPPAFACGAVSATTGFAGPDCPGSNGGTNVIGGTLPSAQPGSGVATPSTLGVIGGVFSYGFQPANTTNTTITTNEAGASRYVPFQIPFYDPGDRRVAVGGPPAYTQFRDGTYPASPQFIGFNQGFIPFMGVTLATGTYNLALTVPSSPTTNVTVSASAALNSTVSPFGSPFAAVGAIVRDGSGGFSVPFVAPAGVTETIVNVTDLGGPVTGPPAAATGNPSCHTTALTTGNPPYYYSAVVQGSGAQTAVFPGNVGPVDPAGTKMPTACPGDVLQITAYGFDYPAYESGVGLPGQSSPPQAPRIAGSNGQADVTISPTTSVSY